MKKRMGAFCLAALLVASSNGRAATLFDDLGGKPGLENLIARATTIYTTDPRIASMFEDTNIERFRTKLYEQICQIADGGCTYTGHTMAEAHRGLHLDTRQFNYVVEDLQMAMDQLAVPFTVQNRLVARLAPMYRDVVSR